MPALDRLTTSYSDSEDRLRVAGQHAESDGTVALWLTRRLANRLVEVLTQWLDEAVREGQAVFDSGLHHAWAQEAATRQMEPAEPVAVAHDSPPGLVVSVDLSRDDEHYCVIFRTLGDRQDDPPFVRFAATELRQWLGIVYSLYRAADWPLESWPEWIANAGDDRHPPAVLH